MLRSFALLLLIVVLPGTIGRSTSAAVGSVAVSGRIAAEAVDARGFSCVGLDRPVSGAVIRVYGPVGRYSGHWGTDLAALPGTSVRAAAGGTVTFAGSVVDNLTVTIAHGGGLKTSYSYLSELAVAAGALVGRGGLVGRSGPSHGDDALHFSVRVDGVYVNPESMLGCRARGPDTALRLVPAFAAVHAYAPRRATRHSGRNLRSATSGTSDGGRGGLPAVGSRHRDTCSCGGTLAESRSGGVRVQTPVGDDPGLHRGCGLLRG